MKFIILGMGAVGSFWAAKFYQQGHSVFGLCRGNHYNKIKQNGLKYESVNGKIEIIKENSKFQVFTFTDQPGDIFDSLAPDDWIIMTSKAYSIKDIIERYKNEISKHGSILLLQNGIGNEDIVKNIIPSLEIYRGTTTNGCFIVEPGYIRHTGIGTTKIGYPDINSNIIKPNQKENLKNLKDILKILKNTRTPAEIVNNIDLIIWEKILINIGINAIASINNILNGDLVKSQKLKNEMAEAITEAWTVARIMKIDLDTDVAKYINLTYEVASKTAKNKNSMLQDLVNGRPTEIDFINGKIVEYAENNNIKVPQNSKLTEQIHLLQEKQ